MHRRAFSRGSRDPYTREEPFVYRLIGISLGVACVALTRKRPDALFARIVEDAYLRGASHVHVGDRIRHRVDGELRDGPRLSGRAVALLARHVSRLPRRLAFRGSSGFELDLAIRGDVIELLVRSTILIGLEVLDLWPEVAERLQRKARERRALILFAGEAGSGRTIAARAVLAELDPARTRVVAPTTLERYEELDADALLVERLRDAATADLALEAALEGRLVLATIVARDAAGALDRLRGLASPSLLPGLALVLAQRLVARRCRTCKAEGCARCRGTGYKGFVALQEVLILEGDSTRLVRSFDDDARWKIERGITDARACARALTRP
jgi:type II secretory ATPase GspE/PulE/Tfp pilus assembly ATPase PilB-like protein